MIIPAQPITDPATEQDRVNSPSIPDGTEGKKEKDDYQESEDRLNDIINSIADPVFVKDDRFQFVLVNDALCTMLGMRRENIIGKTLGESLPKDQMDHFFEIDKKVFDSGQEDVSEELLTGQGGKILTIVTKKTRYVDKKGNKFLVGIIRDISDRKQSEELLRKSNELYNSTISAINDGVWDWDVKTGNAFFSETYYKMLGYNDKEFPANYTSWKSLVHPDDVERADKELQEGIGSEKGFHINFRMKMKSGEWLWVSTRGKAIEKDKDGKAVRMVGTLTDISGQMKTDLQLKQTAEILQVSEEKYRTILDTALDAMVVANDQDHIELWNEAAVRMFGYTKDEMIGKTLHQIIPSMQEHREKKDRLHEFQQTGMSDVIGKSVELPVRKKDGTTLTVELTIGSMHLLGKWYAVGVMRDVTDRKKMEFSLKEKIQELEKMNSLMVGRELTMVQLKEKLRDAGISISDV